MPEELHLKKQFGQNFIQSSEVIDDIIEAFRPGSNDFVIEIGPGAGALTIPLSEQVGHLSAIEVDPRLVIRLRDEFASSKNVEIIADDVLQIDFHKVLENGNAKDFDKIKIIGNIPYNITSLIIEKVLSSDIPFENFTLMIQKEVAERICAEPGTRRRGYMSIFVQYYTEPTYIRTVTKDLFMPVPKVDSAVVNLQFRKEPPVDCDREKLFAVVKQSFLQKRKTLANSLAGYNNRDKQAISELLSSIDIDPQRRAETLSLEEFSKLAKAL